MTEVKINPHLPRHPSFENVVQLIHQEGRSARNLVCFNVPVHETLKIDTDCNFNSKEVECSSIPAISPTQVTSPSRPAVNIHNDAYQPLPARPGKQLFRKVDIRTRYWSFMFDGLRRAVDAIYETCLADRSAIECKEAIMILENYAKDFAALIDYLKVEAAWEKTDRYFRPTSVTWEVRKSIGSPNKLYSASSPPFQKKVKMLNVSVSANLESSSDIDKEPTIETVASSTLNSEVATDDAGLTEAQETFANAEVNAETDDDVGWQLVDRSHGRRNSFTRQRQSQQQLPSPTADSRGINAKQYIKSVRALFTDTHSHDSASSSHPHCHAESYRNRPYFVDSQQRGMPAQHSHVARVLPFPRTAAEIRQTKASIAKLAHSRQYLEEQRWKEQNEQQWRFGANRGPVPKKVASMPALSADLYGGVGSSRPISCGSGGGRSRAAIRRAKFRSYRSNESLCSLQSIKEDIDDTALQQAEDAMLCDNQNSHSIAVENGDQANMGECSNESEQLLVTSLQNINDSECDIDLAAVRKSRELTPDQEAEEEQTLQHLTQEERSLAEEEQNLQLEIEAEERKSIDTETEIAMEAEHDAADADNSESPVDVPPPMDEDHWQERVHRWSTEVMDPSADWGLMVEEEFANASEMRKPGQAVQLHEKLSSPSRRKPLKDTIQRQQERQMRAEKIRQKLLAEQTMRLKELSKKVEEVRAARDAVTEKKKILLETRMSRAEVNRTQQLLRVVKKAHDEDEKVQEIAFINTLEAENKRHDVRTRHHGCEQRMHVKEEERQRKFEEKAAREAAAEGRRRTFEQQKQARLAEMAEKRRNREQQAKKQRSEQEKERLQQARDKAKGREERIAEIKAAKQASSEVLLQKIHDKQEKTIKRYEENLEQIKLRASEMSTPRPHTATFAIPTEVHLVSHLGGQKHIDALKESSPASQRGRCDSNSSSNATAEASVSISVENKENISDTSIIDAPEDKLTIGLSVGEEKSTEKAKMTKRRRQIIRKKLQAKAVDYDTCAANQKLCLAAESTNKTKMQKCVKEIGRLVESNSLERCWLDADIHQLERSLGELSRLLAKKDPADQECFVGLGGVALLLKFFVLLEKKIVPVIPLRSIVNVISLLKLSAQGSLPVSLYLLYTNRFIVILDSFMLIMQELKCGKEPSPLFANAKSFTVESVCETLLDVTQTILDSILPCFRSSCSKKSRELLFAMPGGLSEFFNRVHLYISYVVYAGMVEHVSTNLLQLGELPSDSALRFAEQTLNLVILLLNILSLRGSSPFTSADCNDSTNFVTALKQSKICGVVSLLYSLLLNPASEQLLEASLNGSCQKSVVLPQALVCFVKASFELMNAMASVSALAMQEVISQEGISLEFRHIASFLVAYCIQANSGDNENALLTSLLHQVVLAIGYFAYNHVGNQNLVQSGTHPSILQQLCLFPFSYFAELRLGRILFPTLISCILEQTSNREIVEQELSCILLADFIDEELHKHAKAASPDLIISDESKDEAMFRETCKNASDDSFAFWRRFPFSRWEETRDYFMKPLPAVSESGSS